MKSFAATIFAVGLGCVALVAQSTTSQTSASTPGQGRGMGTVTLVGCLERAAAGQATAGTTGATSAATSSTGEFVLANASRGASATTGASTTPSTSVSSSSGVTAPDGTGTAAMNYALEGNAADLTPHVGHRIEVTGMMAPMMGSRGAGTTGGTTAGAPAGTGTASGTGASTTGAAAATATGTGATAAARGMSPRFTVTSVRMISADCGATR